MTMAGPRFTPRQLAVIALVAQGMTNREAGEALGIAETAIVTRLHNAILTSGMGTRAGLVAQACRWGQLQSLPAQNPGRQVVLTPTQAELLGLLALGLMYREIAPLLRLRVSGVAYRAQRLLRALGARDRAHAVLIAWQLRILPEATR